MKYLTVFIAVAMSCLFFSLRDANATSLQQTNIHLKVEGLPAAWVYLNGVHNNTISRIDSAKLDTEGNAYFQRDTLFEAGVYSIILPDSTLLEVLLDQDQVFTLQTSYPNVIQDMQVEGSTENQILYSSLQYDIGMSEQFQAEIQRLQTNTDGSIDQVAVDQIRQKLFAGKEAQLNQLFTQHPASLFTKYMRAQEIPKETLDKILKDQSITENERTFLMLDHYWDNVDFSDARLLRTPVIFNRLNSYFYQYSPNQTLTKLRAIDVLMNKVAHYPDYYRFFAVWIAENYSPDKETKIDKEALYVHMVDNYLNYQRAFWADSAQVYAWQLRAGDKAKSLIGKQAQNIIAKDTQGKKRALYDIKKPYVAIFFYHAECDHCQETAPRLAKVYEQWKGAGLEVYAVSMDTPADEWKAFLAKYQMEDMVNVTDEDNYGIYSDYYVMGTPYVYLLNPDRTIIGKDLQVEEIPRYMAMDQQAMAAEGQQPTGK